MSTVRRAALLVVPAALALSACGIPATGVVEAGGPASGIPATTPLYFVRDGGLVAVHRSVPEAGDVRAAVEALLQGPDEQERLQGLTTLLAQVSEPTTLFPTVTASPAQDGTAGSPSVDPTESPSRAVRVTTERDGVTVELPAGMAKVFDRAAEQVICTAARAFLLAPRDVESATVTVTSSDGRRAEGSEQRCPDA
ncbi:hypothetical protein [Streptomyces sp. NPDC096132]|uniref:hypothetical protein n=1 Tax=Streptomyces sp. NPDC096132 TaxID=3366075 RepID=UPI00382BCEA2